ncbi:MAG: alpha/beta fold hydrolase [Pseudomonadota bacterium]
MAITRDMPTGVKRPSGFSRLRELASPLEIAAGVRRAGALRDAPAGDGRPVVLIPGYLAVDASMTPMSRFLKSIGYQTFASGLGYNAGDVDKDVARTGARVEEVQARNDGAPVTMIGWSLGGVIARETARLFSDSVREVITLGTPIIGGPKYTSVGPIYAHLNNLDMDEFEKEVHRRNSIGLSQPLTSIYSKSDGVVGWEASIDVYNPQTRNIEVTGSHFSLGLNPKVWRIIADVLAQE